MPHTKDFMQLERNLFDEYFGKKVPKKYQKRYGKVYGKDDIKQFAYAVARTRKIKIDK